MNENSQYKILVVDDELDLCEVLRYNLSKEGYAVTKAYSAEEALSLDLATFDLLLLDVMMEGMSGFQLARRLKTDGAYAHIPIIFLTAKVTEEDMLRGFGAGADDYITKPFRLPLVLARVKAVLHRAAASQGLPAEPHTLRYEGLVMDVDTKTVSVDGKEQPFTKTEFQLLELLLSHQRKVFSRQELIDSIWPRDVFVLDRTVDVNITRIRKKIGRYASCIATRLGYGYYFDA